MKQFLAIYLGSAASKARAEWDALDEATRNERIAVGMKAWGDWMVANQSAIVVEGGPLGKTKQASKSGVDNVRNNMTGYIVIEAESHEAAAKLFLNHPHFTNFPGESVEIMECMPMPKAP